jgi:hypothetical protein
MGVAHEHEGMAMVFCLVLLIGHLSTTPLLKADLKIGALSLLCGVALDSILQYFSIIKFHGVRIEPLSPFWLWGLWLLFGMTLHSSLGFLLNRPLFFSAVLGFVFGPFSYCSGAVLGAAVFDPVLGNALPMAVAWSLMLTWLVAFAARDHSESRQGLGDRIP